MQANKKKFIELAINYQALKFGEFELKSGRISPYFFNAGLFNRGHALAELGSCYANCIVENKIDYDILFGPAYKGIPLVSAIAYALYANYNIDVPYAFNRKEAKSHGEGGQIVGATLTGKALIVDDVITAGTAIKQAFSLIQAQQASVSAVLIALNRQEKGAGEQSAIEEIQMQYACNVFSIITLKDLIDYLSNESAGQALANYAKPMQRYRKKYGID